MRRAVVVVAVILLALAGACRKKDPVSQAAAGANKVSIRSVQLFYGGADQLLMSEPRNVSLPQASAAALPLVMRELVKGPAGKTSLRLLPADTVVRGAWLLPGGTVIVDLGGQTLTAGWGTGSHQELLAIQSLVQTATANFADAQRVRVLVNGNQAETLGGHIALSRSFAPRADSLGQR